MTDRIVEIADTAAHLSLENHLLKIRLPDGRSSTLPVAELQCLILANPAATVTGALLAELAAAGGVAVICGRDRLPAAMQLPLNGNYVQSERFRAQADASLPLRKRLWQCVVKEKIRRQGALLRELHGDDFGLSKLSAAVNSGDPENLEGRAAVIYWKNLFCTPFLRDRENADNNLLLNYGYAILRAMAARACCAAGLHPTLGIHHHNRYDSCCLADDLMEPFRCVIDRKVAELNPENAAVGELTRPLRAELLRALLERQETRAGEEWRISDLLRSSAQQLAESFLSGEMKLNYR